MKKLIIMALIATITITSSSCKAEETGSQNSTPETQKPVQSEEQIPIKPEEKVVEGPLKLAYEGKLDNLQIGVGASLAEVMDVMGEPMELNHFEGSSYITYPSIVFMMDRIVEDIGDEAEVLGIIAPEGYELYGVKVGMTPSEIKKVLGAAEQEYMDGEGEESTWKLEYKCGDYMLTFFFTDQTAASSSAYLSRFVVQE